MPKLHTGVQKTTSLSQLFSRQIVNYPLIQRSSKLEILETHTPCNQAMRTVCTAGSKVLLLPSSMTPYTLVYHLLASFTFTSCPPFLNRISSANFLPLMMPALTRRSRRLLKMKPSALNLSDFDYPGPKQNPIHDGRIRKPTFLNRRLREQVIVIEDDEPKPQIKDTPAVELSPIRQKGKFGTTQIPLQYKRSVKPISHCISIGRVQKPNLRREQLRNKQHSLATTNLYEETPNSKPCALPTSPAQDSHISSSAPPAAFSVAFEPEGPVLGREEESKQLRDYLSCALVPGRPSIGIYVCGTPGTGKTYTVSKVTKRLRTASVIESDRRPPRSAEDRSGSAKPVSTEFKEIWVNCANLHQAKDLYLYLANELDLCLSQQNPRDAIREYACSSGPKTLVILDEVDFLTSKDQMVLYSAFEWPRITNSRIVVVGIANSIDLPVRMLPWLRQAGCMPQILSFSPYRAPALQKIVKQRIHDQGSSALTAVAISLAAKKVAAGSGDARLMLDVCREAARELDRQGHDKSCIAIVSSIISRRGGLSAAVETIRQLPVQQQLALCVAANAVSLSKSETIRQGKSIKKATLGGLYDSFVRLCQRAHVSVLSFPEFADICCNALMHHGLVDVPLTGRGKSAKTLRGRPIRLRIPVEDVRAGIADKGFLPMLLVK